MTTQSTVHPIHHMLAILAGDTATAPNSETAPDPLARVITRLGLGGLRPDPLDADGAPVAEPWFVRVTFPGIAPPDAFIVSLATAAGLQVESLAQGPSGLARWLLVAPQPRAAISSAVRQLRAAHRIHAVPFRQTEGR